MFVEKVEKHFQFCLVSLISGIERLISLFFYVETIYLICKLIRKFFIAKAQNLCVLSKKFFTDHASEFDFPFGAVQM